MSTKSIMFKGEITSSGIVNFDGKPSWLLKQALKDRVPGMWHDNIKVAKHAITKVGTKKEDDSPIYETVLKISRDCLRNGIFKNDQPFHNPGIVHAEQLLINYLTSAAGLLRGYMFADMGIKKKSGVYISDARQTSKNVSTIDIGTQDAPKDKKVDPEGDGGLTMHFKESIGGLVTYEFYGSIDICELQFISLSQVYDRLAVDPNLIDAYITALEKTLGSKVSSKTYYIRKTSTNGLPEEGILLTQDQVKKLIGEFFTRLIDLEIIRGASGRAWLSKLEITPKTGGLDFGKNLIPVTDTVDVLKLIGEPHIFYDVYDEAEAIKLYDKFEEGKNKKMSEKSAAKAAKAAEKAAAKIKKESASTVSSEEVAS